MVYDESKLGTELNLALNIPEEERNKSLDLEIGYNNQLKEWELIIRYTGSLEAIGEEIGFSYTELLNGYAIIWIATERIEMLTNHPSVIFIEKPKSLYAERTERINGFSQSCMDLVRTDTLNLTGNGVMVAVIDSGIDIYHEDFRDGNRSKIYELWDQTASGNPPDGFRIGSVYSNEKINEALRGEGERIPTFDSSGHGTGVASVVTACAPDVDLLVVKLASQDDNGFPRTTALMMAIDYAVRISMKRNIPMVINLSFGNNYGDHGSNSLLETYIDSVSILSRLSIVTGMGNDGNTGRHAQLMLGNTSWQQAEFQVNPFSTGINLQVWRNYSDVVDISLITPSNQEIGPFNRYQEVMNYQVNGMYINVINGYPTPINQNQETYISISPQEEYIERGIWKVRFQPKSIFSGRLDLWLPVAGSTSANVQFIRPSEFTTLTIPSSASNVISVGAYDPVTLSYAAFSGRGNTIYNVVKPDLSAPGVNILVATPGGGYAPVSGTSFATPFVSAGAAMLMEWGITKRNDLYLYGDKLKAYLIKGARRLPGFASWPNEKLGYGALCVSESIPK